MTLSTTALDPKIPFLADTLDPHQAQTQLQTLFPNLRAVTAATLVRHKPGRRALIEYQLDTSAGPLTILGKIRAKGTDWHSYKIQQALWNRGWAADRPDGFSVPEPLGVIPDWHMGLQRKVPGIPATDVLPTDAGIPLATASPPWPTNSITPPSPHPKPTPSPTNSASSTIASPRCRSASPTAIAPHHPPPKLRHPLCPPAPLPPCCSLAHRPHPPRLLPRPNSRRP
jgi:hypothetical protein